MHSWSFVSTDLEHPSYSHYYLLSPSTLFFLFLYILLFFAHLVVFLHIFFAHLIVFCTSYCFLHILLFCTFFIFFVAHFTLISPFLTICMPLCYVTLYNLYSYYFALSTERTWFDYISLLIIPCITIMWQIKKPWTLNLERHCLESIWRISVLYPTKWNKLLRLSRTSKDFSNSAALFHGNLAEQCRSGQCIKSVVFSADQSRSRRRINGEICTAAGRAFTSMRGGVQM